MVEHHTVLVVEDEEDSRDSLGELLRLEGFDVEVASNGLEAIHVLDRLGEKVCLMLLDLYMPVMDGWQVIDFLRADGRLSTTNIVITTSSPDKAPKGLPTLAKPLDIGKVVTKVRELC